MMMTQSIQTLCGLVLLVFAIGCSSEDSNGPNSPDGSPTNQPGNGAAVDPTFASVCTAILAKGETDQAWQTLAAEVYTADTCPDLLETESSSKATEAELKAQDYLPGIMKCVEQSALFTDFTTCTEQVYETEPVVPE